MESLTELKHKHGEAVAALGRSRALIAAYDRHLTPSTPAGLWYTICDLADREAETVARCEADIPAYEWVIYERESRIRDLTAEIRRLDLLSAAYDRHADLTRDDAIFWTLSDLIIATGKEESALNSERFHLVHGGEPVPEAECGVSDPDCFRGGDRATIVFAKPVYAGDEVIHEVTARYTVVVPDERDGQGAVKIDDPRLRGRVFYPPEIDYIDETGGA